MGKSSGRTEWMAGECFPSLHPRRDELLPARLEGALEASEKGERVGSQDVVGPHPFGDGETMEWSNDEAMTG